MLKIKSEIKSGAAIGKAKTGLYIAIIVVVVAIVLALGYVIVQSNNKPEREQSNSAPAPKHSDDKQPKDNNNKDNKDNKNEKEDQNKQGLSKEEILSYSKKIKGDPKYADKMEDYIQTWMATDGGYIREDNVDYRNGCMVMNNEFSGDNGGVMYTHWCDADKELDIVYTSYSSDDSQYPEEMYLLYRPPTNLEIILKRF